MNYCGKKYGKKIQSITLILFILLPFGLQSQKYLDRLESKAEFDKLSGLPLSGKYGQVSALKLVYDVNTDRLYFVSSGYYTYHFDFCESMLDYGEGMETFNRLNYSGDSHRSYLLANINYYKSSGIYALEIHPVDLMSNEQISLLYKKVAGASYIGDSLQFLLNSARLQMAKDSLKNHVPLLEPSKIYNNLAYQAISRYKRDGILRFVDNLELEKNTLMPTDIIVLDKTPMYLPIVSGIIITEFQTPLSHLTILGQDRKIPVSAYKAAFSDSLLRSFENKKVSYKVLRDTFEIELTDDIDEDGNSSGEISLDYDLSVDTLINIEVLDDDAVEYAGNKAANFGKLFRLSKKASFKTPESAFVIPFYFYNYHIEHTEAKALIDSLLNNKTNFSEIDTLQGFLRRIREVIENSPVDTVLLNSINKKIQALGEYSRMRFRSSTNAEDAEGFSGAGLYTSETGILFSKKKPIDKALKKVWASLWSFEAYSEREYYNINHGDAYMGVLVHRSFPDESVNGVAITKNLYNDDEYGFVVNAQLGDESVVKPKPYTVTDQFVCYPENSDYLPEAYDGNIRPVDIITISSLNGGKLVMTDTEIRNLANQIEIIKKYFYKHTSTRKWYFNFGLDIEFKLSGTNRELYIKQVRLYND